LKSGKIPNTHSIGSIGYPNFGVFAVGEIATENAYAVPPTHLVTRTPDLIQSSLQRRRTPTTPLTGLARRACWQSLPTRHRSPHSK
jgi:hypothetical protein